MHRRAVAVVVLLACTPPAGCILLPCGEYVVANTETTSADGRSYNGTWTEACSAESGTTGVWSLTGDGDAEIWFGPSDAGDRWLLPKDIDMKVAFPTTLLVPGEVIEADRLTSGRTFLVRCAQCADDAEAVTSARIDVLSGWEGEDPCILDPGPAFHLRWDIVFGDDEGPRYTAHGEDDVEFGTFLSESCGST